MQPASRDWARGRVPDSNHISHNTRWRDFWLPNRASYLRAKASERLNSPILDYIGPGLPEENGDRTPRCQSSFQGLQIIRPAVGSAGYIQPNAGEGGWHRFTRQCSGVQLKNHVDFEVAENDTYFCRNPVRDDVGASDERRGQQLQWHRSSIGAVTRSWLIDCHSMLTHGH